MKLQYALSTLVFTGMMILICGLCLHGAPGDLKNSEDRRRMERGTAVAVGGLALISLGVLIRKAAHSSYDE